MEGGADPLQDSPACKEASASDLVSSEQTTDVPEDQEDQQRRDQRPSGCYLSVKSDRSMDGPINFRGRDPTLKEEVHRRPESPTSEETASSIHPPPNMKSGEVLCDICSEIDSDVVKRAVKTCETCSTSYCENHVRRHVTEARFQKHQLVDVPRGAEQRLCQDHHRPLEVFCRTDQMLICSQCSVTKHRGHDTHHQTEPAGGKLRTFDGEHRKSLTSVNVLPPPGEIRFLSVTSNAVTLRWGPPEGVKGPKKFTVTWEGDWEQKSLSLEDVYEVEIDTLQPGQKYTFKVATGEPPGSQSEWVSATVTTVVPPPRDIKADQLGVTSFSLRWSTAEGMEHLPQCFLISYHSPGAQPMAKLAEDCCRTLTGLQPGTEYTVSLSTVLKNQQQSQPVSTTIWTILPVPVQLTVVSVDATSATVSWEQPGGMDLTQLQYQISYQCPGRDQRIITTSSLSIPLPDLQPASEYSVSLCSMLDNGKQSESISTTIRTMRTGQEHSCNIIAINNISKSSLGSYLKTLGLEQHFTKKLTLNATLAINSDMLKQANQEQRVPTPESLLVFFLRELMKANVLARNAFSDEKCVNPLDLITGLFLCSDHFLQQEIALKMSMCQFALPLLLPNCDTEQSTLMLWAMRDIVRRFRPQSLTDQKGFVESSIVLIELPLVSFVRLGNSSLPKSEFLNEVLSKSQQTNCSFVHRNMTGGNTPRQISEGLVEISWYLPGGNPNIDVFPEPVAVANLRGDIQDFQTQFQFLCETSAAVFMFCDDFGSDDDLLNFQHMGDRLFIVSNTDAKGYDAAKMEKLLSKPTGHIKKGSRMNNIQLVKKLHSVVTDVLKRNPLKFSVEKMADVAKKYHISVDEDFRPCQDAKKKACLITDHISDTTQFKNKHLPLHGEVLGELAKLEREESKLKNAGSTNIETYKGELRREKQKLRSKQFSQGMNDIMSKFTDGLRESKESCFFLKWIKMNLDNLSRTHLSNLKEKYKSICQSSLVDQTALSDLEKRISTNSLGTEHFLREMGQIYESAQSLPKDFRSCLQFEDLPQICAQLMLDGFPLELIDGDTSNLPIMWISDVFRELHRLTSSNSKVRVITVLGVQSSGKSTLLNTMFGIQFAVSSGRCTRGAFMQLIRVEEDLKKQLECDLLMIIDTEGLKALELAQLANSYEHDNELATLVVGLSDITIVNIAMENSTEMKDTLQIVVHAFLRMKEVGRKHMCQFVHQNVPDCSAHEKNSTDRNRLLKDLDKMTEVAAEMEKKEDNKKFTDIMVYDPNKDSWYLPGLWFGNPPMAPVNAGYSEAVNEFKKCVIQRLTDAAHPAHTLLDFMELTQSLWNAVKHENFIFSFRNSLEADAYNMLSVELSKWELDLRNHMQSWWQQAEVQMSNYGTVANRSGRASNLEELKEYLKCECTAHLEKEGEKLLQKLEDYFDQKQNNIHLLVKYRENFVNSAMMLKVDIKNSINSKLEITLESKRDMIKIDELKKSQSDRMEEQVIKLLDECREKKSELNPDQLKVAFDKTWNDTVKSLDIRGLDTQDIDTDILTWLRSNMERRGSRVHEIIGSINSLDNSSPSTKGAVVSGSSLGKKVVGFFKSGSDYLKRVFKKCPEKQDMVELITTNCKRFVEETLKLNSDYNSMLTIHLLKLIDDTLEKSHQLKIDAECEAHLKIDICGHASREYQKMHISFLEANDPLKCLEKFKSEYFTNFKDLFEEGDQCQRKAEDFTKLCLEPAVRTYVNKSLGSDIVNEVIQTREGIAFSTRTFFQFSILKQLLSNDVFEQYAIYITDYHGFVKEFIVQRIESVFSSGDRTIGHLEDQKLEGITRKIEKVIENLEASPTSKEHSTTDVCSFIEGICQELSTDLVIPQDALNSVLHLNKAKTKPFSDRLKVCVREMKQSLSAEFHKDNNVKTKLEGLPSKPQDELFDYMIGCGHQCPFCTAPCEAGERGHREHFIKIHRPEGIGMNQWTQSRKMVSDICSSLVASKTVFKNSDTRDMYHPFRKYRLIYPDWRIQPDPSIEASDYWKYVFAKYNQQFAHEYQAEPADIPPGWLDITKEQAMESLETTYRLKV